MDTARVFTSKTTRGFYVGLALSLFMFQTNINALTIPPNSPHPRLWYGNTERLNQARSFFQAHPISIPGYPLIAGARNRALRFLMNGNATECTAAINQLLAYNFTASDEDGDGDQDPGSCDLSSEGLYCDRARWGGEDAILTYDWCHDQMSDTQRNTLITRWNNYIGSLNLGPYGWQERPINNYFWGYLRNSLLWGIATAGENPRAQEFINHGLNTRYGQYFVPWSTTFGVGGVPGEGTQYGAYPLGYSVIALQSAKDFGADAWVQTNFYDEAVYYLNYATSPGPTLEPNASNPRYELFPFNDDHDFEGGGSAMSGDYANLLGAQILRAPNSPRASHARAWLQRTGQQPDWWIQAALAAATGPSNTDDLPLDYFAAGYKFLFTRSDRGNQAMSTMMQFGAIGADTRGGVEHNSRDAGSFQIWRAGRWASRESTGYRGSDFVAGLGGVGRADVDHPIAHNTVLFEGNGQLSLFHAQPNLLRLRSAPRYAFIAANMRNAYRSHAGAVPSSQCWLAEDDWPFAEVVIREYLLIREWHALLVFDRLRAGDDSMLPIYADNCGGQGYDGPRKNAATVNKTFLMHFSASPTIQGTLATGVKGNQATDLHTLFPSNVSSVVVNESQCTDCNLGQFRLEQTQSGSAESHFLHLVQARNNSDAPITASLNTSGNEWVVSLTRSNGETAIIRLQSGMQSVGGSIQFGNDPAEPLYAGIQSMSVQAAGPVWENLEGIENLLFRNGFE